jgi:hypothetical protein
MEPKYQYTKDNHFKWGWENPDKSIDWYGSPKMNAPYHIKLGYVTREVKSFREECIETVKLMAATTTKPIIVGLSGGSDSQMVSLSLIAAQIPFEALIVRFTYNGGSPVNMHDISVAYEFCKKFNVQYKELDVDLDVFYRTKALELSKKYNMPKLRTIVQTEAMEWAGQNGYYYIMAGGDPVFYPLPPEVGQRRGIELMTDQCTVPCWLEGPVPILQYMVDKEYEGSSKFYLYTPELHVSYLNDPVTTEFLRTKKVIYENFIEWFPHRTMWWKLFQNLFKPILATKHFPELIPAKKFTGFEGIYRQKGIPSNINVYRELLDNSVKGVSNSGSVITPIEDIVPYLTRTTDLDKTLVSKVDLAPEDDGV